MGTLTGAEMKKDVAAKISDLMQRYGNELNQSVGLVEENCSEAAWMEYRDAVAKLLTTALIDIMNPIYRQYPDLTPDALVGTVPTGACRIYGKVGFGGTGRYEDD